MFSNVKEARKQQQQPSTVRRQQRHQQQQKECKTTNEYMRTHNTIRLLNTHKRVTAHFMSIFLVQRYVFDHRHTLWRFSVCFCATANLIIIIIIITHTHNYTNKSATSSSSDDDGRPYAVFQCICIFVCFLHVFHLYLLLVKTAICTERMNDDTTTIHLYKHTSVYTYIISSLSLSAQFSVSYVYM